MARTCSPGLLPRLTLAPPIPVPGDIHSAPPAPAAIDQTRASAVERGGCGIDRWRSPAALGRARARALGGGWRAPGLAGSRAVALGRARSTCLSSAYLGELWVGPVPRTCSGTTRRCDPRRHGCCICAACLAERRRVRARFSRIARQHSRGPQRMALVRCWKPHPDSSQARTPPIRQNLCPWKETLAANIAVALRTCEPVDGVRRGIASPSAPLSPPRRHIKRHLAFRAPHYQRSTSMCYIQSRPPAGSLSVRLLPRLVHRIIRPLDHPPLLIVPTPRQNRPCQPPDPRRLPPSPSCRTYQIRSLFLMVCLRPSWYLQDTVPSGLPK